MKDFENNIMPNNEDETLDEAIKILNSAISEKNLVLLQMEDQMGEIDDATLKYGVSDEEGQKRLLLRDKLENDYRALQKEYIEEKKKLEDLLNIKKTKDKQRKMLEDFEVKGYLN